MAGTLDFAESSICSANIDDSGAFSPCSNYSYINQNYGDMAEMDASYLNANTDNTSLQFWSTSYNQLEDILWAGGNDSNSRGRITLAATDGYFINLDSLDLGAYPSSARYTHLTVSNGIDTYAFEGAVGTGNLASTFSAFGAAGIGSNITIEWYNSAYNVGIDNIHYTVMAVPEPASLAMLMAGLGLLGLMRIRKS